MAGSIPARVFDSNGGGFAYGLPIPLPARAVSPPQACPRCYRLITMENNNRSITISVRQAAGEYYDTELTVTLRPADQIEVDLRLWKHGMQMPAGRYQYTTTCWDTMSYELAQDVIAQQGREHATPGAAPSVSADIPTWMLKLLEDFDPV